jgi:gamma-glutamyltranspeptidase/glutathione hydrolase
LALLVLALAVVPALASDLTRPTIMGRNGMIACGHWLAANAGADILKKGGNAFDAGVATVLAQSVLEFDLFGFGGEAPTLVYVAKDKKVYSVDGNTAGPKGVTFDWFEKNGILMIPGDGLLAAGVPAALDAMILILDKWGTKSFSEVAAAAYKLADEGFPMYHSVRNNIRAMEKRFREEWPTSAALFLPGGKVPDFGEIFVQKDLAFTFKRLIEAEQKARKAGKGRSAALKAVRDRFYKGDIAEQIVKFQKENAFLDATGKKHTGLLTMEDFKTYSAKLREPWTVNYRGYDVYKLGAWTQGPTFLQILNILENFDLQALKHNSADYLHVWIEAAKLAHADRVQFYGDPDFVETPKAGLLSKEYAKERAKLIDMKKAAAEMPPGEAWKYNDKPQTKQYGYYPRELMEGTTGTRVMDAQGNMFSATPSGGWFRSSPVVPGVGIALGTRMQMMDVDRKDSPRAFAPGKRPTTSLTPTLVLKDGKPFAILGTPGGDDQDQVTNQSFLNLVVFGMEVQSAIDAPKVVTKHFPSMFYPHNAVTNASNINPGVPEAVIKDLQARGHKLTVTRARYTDATTMIMYNPETKVMFGGASAPPPLDHARRGSWCQRGEIVAEELRLPWRCLRFSAVRGPWPVRRRRIPSCRATSTW